MSVDIGMPSSKASARGAARRQAWRCGTNPGPSDQHSLLVGNESLVEVLPFPARSSRISISSPMSPASIGRIRQKADAVAVFGEGEETARREWLS